MYEQHDDRYADDPQHCGGEDHDLPSSSLSFVFLPLRNNCNRGLFAISGLISPRFSRMELISVMLM